jgi:hypothetical protein
MVRDSAPALPRLLRPLGVLRDLPTEVCLVDTGSRDGTVDRAARLCGELGLRFEALAVSPLSRPDLYFEEGGRSHLADYAAPRNLGLDVCRGAYVLKLDGDDELLEPERVAGQLAWMDQSTVTFLCSHYEVMLGDEIEYATLYTRIWRNDPEVRFRGCCHENVDWLRGEGNWAASLHPRVRDWRDLPRDPGRNLRVLERRHRLEGGLGPQELIYLADEAAALGRSALALEVLAVLPDLHPVDRAWACMIRAKCCLIDGRPDLALSEYRRAADLGWGRARLLMAVAELKAGEGGAVDRLRQAIALNLDKYYPRFAKCSEVREAMALIDRRIECP